MLVLKMHLEGMLMTGIGDGLGSHWLWMVGVMVMVGIIVDVAGVCLPRYTAIVAVYVAVALIIGVI